MQVPAADSLPTLDELIASPPISLKYNRAPPAAADYYAALGLAVDFSEDELKQAYKKQSRAHHPDRAGGSDEAFQLIAAANTCLSDPLCRAAYNQVRRSMHQGCLLNPRNSVFYPFFTHFPPSFAHFQRLDARNPGSTAKRPGENGKQSIKIVENRGN